MDSNYIFDPYEMMLIEAILEMPSMTKARQERMRQAKEAIAQKSSETSKLPDDAA